MSSILPVLICRAWPWKWWTKRWRLMRLPSLLLLRNLLQTKLKSKTLPLLLTATTPLPTLEPGDIPKDAPKEICFFFFFRSNFGTIQSNLKTMHVAPCFNGLFDVNVKVKIFFFFCQMLMPAKRLGFSLSLLLASDMFALLSASWLRHICRTDAPPGIVGIFHYLAFYLRNFAKCFSSSVTYIRQGRILLL